MLGEFIRNHKIISATIVIVLLAFVGYALYVLISRTDKEPVTIYMVPSDAVLTIGGVQYQPGTAYIQPGTYNLKATHGGFEPYEETITIYKPNTLDVNISLVPISDEAKKWKEENMDQYLGFQSRMSTRATDFGRQMNERFPLTTHLPFRNYIYSIGHRLKNVDNPFDGIILQITAITGYREMALDKIRELGFEPTDYEIEFNDYENPFNHE